MNSFAGDHKHGQSILGPVERRFIDWAVPRIPGPILSHHLTLLTMGKHRRQGLVKWGFFMDHLLDLLFAGSVVIAYSFLVRS